MKWIFLSRQSMKLILVGKQMSVSIKSTTLSMEPIVRRNIKNFYLLKSMILMLKLKKISKMIKNLLEHQEMKNSQSLSKKPNTSKRISVMQETFLTNNSHNH